MEEIIKGLEAELVEWKAKEKEAHDATFPEDGDTDGEDWGELNEWYGYCVGRCEAIQTFLTELRK